MNPKEVNIESLIESCKPVKKRGRPSHKRQLQEIRGEHKINLQTADSVVVATNLKSILNTEALKSLPDLCITQLVSLLPESDQVTQEDGSLKPADSALSHEYYARFCSQYQEKLSENKLSDDAVEQNKVDTQKELAKLDPWKLRNYEPIWGQKLISQTLDDDMDEDETLDRLISQVFREKKGKNNSLKRTKERSPASRPKMKK